MGGSACENFDMGPLLRKRISLIATTLKSRSTEYKADLISKLGQIIFPASESEFTPVPVVDKVFGMSKASEAHQYMESNVSIGKILLLNDL